MIQKVSLITADAVIRRETPPVSSANRGYGNEPCRSRVATIDLHQVLFGAIWIDYRQEVTKDKTPTPVPLHEVLALLRELDPESSLNAIQVRV